MGTVIYKNTRLIPAPFPDCCKKEKTVIMKNDKEVFLTEEWIITGKCIVYVGGQMFKVGDKVKRSNESDYRFDGEIVAKFNKLSGVERFVVEDDRGVLHIYSEKNLTLR